MLEHLNSRFTLAVITNTHDPDLVPDHLERMGVSHFFSHVVTSVEHGARKPSPDIFHYTLRLLRVSPEDCVYVGDNYDPDYRGAKAAGIAPLLIDPLRKAPVSSKVRLESVFELERRLSAT